ncbi:small s protein [Cordyceps javanica]|uniref:Small s protein n=1 Tax=Cordyceps javanica TaxID=43265 RepID=A0A545W8H0_9HYPO|nr:small s protein [Cordyceps javanica]TQW10304.1 AAA ATPase domain-containing protein [Cordyceps javanica]
MVTAAHVMPRSSSSSSSNNNDPKTTASAAQSVVGENKDNDAALALLARHGCRLRADVAVTAAAINDDDNDDDGHAKDSATDVPVNLVRACVKIGRDLVLRLDRVGGSAKEASSAAWSLVDLVVLAERLDGLVQQAHDLENSPFPAEELRDLERQLAARLAPNAPPGDEFCNGEHKWVSAKAPEARTPSRVERKKPTRGPRKDVHPENHQPREVSPDILHDFILEGLAYKSMHDREDEVTEAYASTFDWVFEAGQPHGTGGDDDHGRAVEHSLRSWLEATTEEGASPIYWITGKPGSGKSTFMRYLFQHETTARCLGTWSGERRPCLVAGFFFWTSGSREQRSQTGLLRSLLHQFLSAHPDYTAAAFPALWARLRVMPTKERVQLRLEWTVEELLPAFRSFVRVASERMSICLFVDGMDEFEGDHAVLINLFKDLATGPGSAGVKMCLSSRPWPVFRDAFAFAVPNLRLQELTRGDMRRYVSETLAQDGAMKSILERDAAQGSQFVEALIDRADGVFLWVRLAVDKVLERFSRDDGVENLTKLLVALPVDLDELFAKLLFRDQAPEELQQSASLYSLMRAREEVADFVRNDDANNLTVWELAFALDREDDQMILDKVSVEEATDVYITQRGEATINTIKERFSGLLDFHVRTREGNLRLSRAKPRTKGHSMRDRARSRVVYIHRTVRDWLVSCPGIHDKLVQQLPADFDPNLRLLRSYVLQMKRPLVFIEHHRMLDDWWPGITLAMTHARHVARDPERRQRAFVNALDDTIAWWWAPKPHDPYDHWARNAYGSFEVRMKAPPIWQPFLGLAVKFGLRAYVAAELAARRRRDDADAGDDDAISDEMRRLQVDDAVPLLAYATEHLCSRKKTIYPLSDPGLVGDLLRGACRINPGANHGYLDFATRAETTPWLALLRHLRDARRRRWIKRYDTDEDGTKRWVQVVRLFLEVGGADPNALVKADAWDPEITAQGVMELLDDTYGDAEIRSLKTLLHDLQQKSGKQSAA